MRRLAIVGSVVALIAAVLTLNIGSASAVPDPINCTGYPEPRIFLESQAAWWSSDDASYGAAEHVHTGACFPYLGTVSGTVQIDVVTKVHNVPTWHLEFVRVQLRSGNSADYETAVNTARPACGSSDCTYVTTVQVPTNQATSGKWEWRLHSDVRSSTNYPRSLATGGFPACIRDCNGTVTPEAVTWPQVEGRGWYANSAADVRGYENSRILSLIPTTPVSGIWSPTVRTFDGSEGEPVTHSVVTVDPSFHAVPENAGTVLIDQAGQFNGTVNVNTTTLSNGLHHLMVRADADEGNGEKLSGSLVIPFTVDNGTPATTVAPTTVAPTTTLACQPT